MARYRATTGRHDIAAASHRRLSAVSSTCLRLLLGTHLRLAGSLLANASRLLCPGTSISALIQPRIAGASSPVFAIGNFHGPTTTAATLLFRLGSTLLPPGRSGSRTGRLRPRPGTSPCGCLEVGRPRCRLASGNNGAGSSAIAARSFLDSSIWHSRSLRGSLGLSGIGLAGRTRSSRPIALLSRISVCRRLASGTRTHRRLPVRHRCCLRRMRRRRPPPGSSLRRQWRLPTRRRRARSYRCSRLRGPRRATGTIVAAAAQEHLHLRHLAALLLKTIHHAPRAAVDGENPNHNAYDGNGKNPQPYADKRKGR